MSTPGLRIALLSYRGNPHSGGQGVYVRYLSKALHDLGHHVEVIAGQPYPELDEGIALTRLPSLDLYRSDDPFRRPRRHEFRDAIDVAEYALMCTAAFPEPLTFSLRAFRDLGRRSDQFDVVHDNQSLGYGLLRIQGSGLPVVATVHHPCSIDRDLAVAAAPDWKRRASLSRWYSFTRMQGRVARRLPRLISVSESARADVVSEFRVPVNKVGVVHNGVDTDLFRPVEHVARVPGRIITTSSSDQPLKGLVYLIEAIAKVRTERDAELVVVGKRPKRGPIADAIERFEIAGSIRFETGLDRLSLVERYATAEIAAVPSLYEGFSLPVIEAMSCGLPVVATTGGALREIAGSDGDAALLVPPADAGALATALARLIDDRELRARLGARGRARVMERFTWRAAARATADIYERVIAGC